MAERWRIYLSRSWQGKSHEEWTKPGETEKEADSKGDIVLCTSICNQIVATGYGQLVRRNIGRYHRGIRERWMNERQVAQEEVVEETALNRRYFEMYYFYSLFVSSVLRIMCVYVYVMCLWHLRVALLLRDIKEQGNSRLIALWIDGDRAVSQPGNSIVDEKIGTTMGRL